MKINNSRGDLMDVSAIKEPLEYRPGNERKRMRSDIVLEELEYRGRKSTRAAVFGDNAESPPDSDEDERGQDGSDLDLEDLSGLRQSGSDDEDMSGDDKDSASGESDDEASEDDDEEESGDDDPGAAGMKVGLLADEEDGGA